MELLPRNSRIPRHIQYLCRTLYSIELAAVSYYSTTQREYPSRLNQLYLLMTTTTHTQKLSPTDSTECPAGVPIFRHSGDFPGIYTCSVQDRLDAIFDTIRKSRVHRFMFYTEMSARLSRTLQKKPSRTHVSSAKTITACLMQVCSHCVIFQDNGARLDSSTTRVDLVHACSTLLAAHYLISRDQFSSDSVQFQPAWLQFRRRILSASVRPCIYGLECADTQMSEAQAIGKQGRILVT